MKKYLAALLPGIIILFGGLQTALADERIDSVEGSQLLALTAGILVTFVVPIVDGRWAGLFKTGRRSSRPSRRSSSLSCSASPGSRS